VVEGARLENAPAAGDWVLLISLNVYGGNSLILARRTGIAFCKLQ
jgi:hypothetical protein